MSATETRSLQLREVELKRGALLLLASNAEGVWKASLLWIAPGPDGKRVRRKYATGLTCLDALRGCFEDTPFATEAPEVLRYLQGTKWGGWIA
jgi:hypothetical protein